MLKDNPKVVLDALDRTLPKATMAARSLSDDIRLLQKISGWTVREMADFYGVPRATLEDWRQRECPKNLKYIYSIRDSAEHLSSRQR